MPSSGDASGDAASVWLTVAASLDFIVAAASSATLVAATAASSASLVVVAWVLGVCGRFGWLLGPASLLHFFFPACTLALLVLFLQLRQTKIS